MNMACQAEQTTCNDTTQITIHDTCDGICRDTRCNTRHDTCRNTCRATFRVTSGVVSRDNRCDIRQNTCLDASGVTCPAYSYDTFRCSDRGPREDRGSLLVVAASAACRGKERDKSWTL